MTGEMRLGSKYREIETWIAIGRMTEEWRLLRETKAVAANYSNVYLVKGPDSGLS